MRPKQSEPVFDTDPLSHRRCVVLHTCHKLPQVTCGPRVVSCGRHDLIDRYQHMPHVLLISIREHMYLQAYSIGLHFKFSRVSSVGEDIVDPVDTHPG